MPEFQDHSVGLVKLNHKALRSMGKGHRRPGLIDEMTKPIKEILEETNAKKIELVVIAKCRWQVECTKHDPSNKTIDKLMITSEVKKK